MATLIIKKPTAGNFIISDVGVEIPGLGQEDFTGNDNLIRALSASKNTRDAVLAGTLVVNDGIEDLSVYNGIVYLNNLWKAIGFGLGVGDELFPYFPKRVRRSWFIQQNSGLTTVNVAGFGTAPTLNGTTSVVTTPDGHQWINYASAATVNSDAGWISSAFTQVRRDNRPVFQMWVRTGAAAADITSVRIWNGLFSATPMASATPSVHMAAFRYDTGADGTVFWRCITSDAVTITTTITTVPVAVDTAYEFVIDMSNSANVRFFINGTLVATHTTNLPALTQFLGHVEQARTLVAATRNWRNSRIFMEHF